MLPFEENNGLEKEQAILGEPNCLWSFLFSSV